MAIFKYLVGATLVLTICSSCMQQMTPPPPRSLETPPAPSTNAMASNPQRTVRDGVFTQAQAASGQRVYDASCKTCHDMRFYRETIRGWQGQPLLDFWNAVLGQMPADNPSSLLDSEYTEVIAYILSELGFPPGSAALDPKNGMAQITIVTP